MWLGLYLGLSVALVGGMGLRRWLLMKCSKLGHKWQREDTPGGVQISVCRRCGTKVTVHE